ncbi:MAG TPA: ATP-binding protein [Thermoanaerobaculia bacterium]|nr:ATP-binding protein [Thermoanaerobaculia bacterium]
MSGRRSLEGRVARWLAGTLLLLYGVIATAVWATSRTNARQVAVLTLETEVEAVATYVAATGRLDPPELEAVEREPFPIWLRLFDGMEMVAATPGAPDLPWAPPAGTEEVLYLRAPEASEPHLVVRHAIGGKGTRRHRATAVEAIGDIDSLRALERRLVAGLVVLGIVIIPVASWGGRLLARRALAPVATLVDEIRALDPHTLDGRLQFPESAVDEVAVLATSFNDLLARLERSVATMRRFTADASHEIRNPLSVMRTGLEVALRRDRPVEEYRGLLAENLQEIERLQAILEGLLALARAEPGRQASLQKSEVDFTGLVRETAERFASTLQERRVSLDLDLTDHLLVRGDARLLRLVPFNLLDNALKHAPPGEPIAIRTAREDGAVVLRVADRGPGIPVAERSRIFERYVRLSEESSDSGVGGVGLSVVRWVAETHGGEVGLVDTETGACFEVRLPEA